MIELTLVQPIVVLSIQEDHTIKLPLKPVGKIWCWKFNEDSGQLDKIEVFEQDDQILRFNNISPGTKIFVIFDAECKKVEFVASDFTYEEALLEWLEEQGYIYGYMYGHPYIQYADGHREKDKVIRIDKDQLIIGKDRDCLVYIWGYPGPDGNIYELKDYGKTWSFDEETLLTEEE